MSFCFPSSPGKEGQSCSLQMSNGSPLIAFTRAILALEQSKTKAGLLQGELLSMNYRVGLTLLSGICEGIWNGALVSGRDNWVGT